MNICCTVYNVWVYFVMGGKYFGFEWKQFWNTKARWHNKRLIPIVVLPTTTGASGYSVFNSSRLVRSTGDINFSLSPWKHRLPQARFFPIIWYREEWNQSSLQVSSVWVDNRQVSLEWRRTLTYHEFWRENEVLGWVKRENIVHMEQLLWDLTRYQIFI